MREYLNRINLFEPDEIDSFLAQGKPIMLKKGELFIREGQIAQKIAFVKSGILRSFYHSSKSDEVTYCFSFPNEIIAGYSSFITQARTNENIQALSNCELIEFPKSLIDTLVATEPNWLLFSKQVAEQQYVNLEKRIFLLQCETALVRYQELLKEHPEYLQQVPLGYLASYLGVSQRHLSRLRK